MTICAADVRAAIAALPITITEIGCEIGAVVLPEYPGGRRPTSTVRIGEGRGECIAWTEAAHEAFSERVARVLRGRWRLGDWSTAMRAVFTDPYEHAALEAAAIDAALRQARTSVFDVAGVARRRVRYVVSFERVADPLARAQREAPGVELKIDADATWDDAVFTALASLRRVAVLDFKGVADAERAHALVPDALIEDPGPGDWSASLRRRLSLDATVTSAAALDALPARPAAVNLKPARMGGVLEALACAARCAEAGIDVYIGGMFEVGVGRLQLRALAALLCPDGPNDIAPLVPPDRPTRLEVSGVGFS